MSEPRSPHALAGTLAHRILTDALNHHPHHNSGLIRDMAARVGALEQAARAALVVLDTLTGGEDK